MENWDREEQNAHSTDVNMDPILPAEAARLLPVCSTPERTHGPKSLQRGWTGDVTVHNISLPVCNSQVDSQVIIDLNQADDGETARTCFPLTQSSNTDRPVSTTRMARVSPSKSFSTCAPSTSTANIHTKKIFEKGMKRRRGESQPEEKEEEKILFNQWLRSCVSKNKAKEEWCNSEIVKNKSEVEKNKVTVELAELQKQYFKLQIQRLNQSTGGMTPELVSDEYENEGGFLH